MVNGEWQTGPAFPLPISYIQTITCDEILYGHIIAYIHYYNYGYSAIDGLGNKKIYRLTDDEREWIEVGEIPEKRNVFGVAPLNGKIYITGGFKSLIMYDK